MRAVAVVGATVPWIAMRENRAAAPEDGPALSQNERDAIGGIARKFMEQFKVPGMSVAFAKDGKFVLQQGFGVADVATKESVTPAHLFRIASVSKPFTAVTIFSLIEQGRLGLDDLVFGEKGRLGFDFGNALPGDVREITVHHLLTHTSGWTPKAGDPMFLNPAMNHRELIEWTIKNQPLQTKPGTAHAYSNFGYCILGRLVEKLTGLTYAQAVQRDVLAKCGITTMRIGGSTLAERVKSEVTYYAPEVGNAVKFNPAYSMNVARMDSHGGWIATAADLVRFVMHVDCFPNPPDILRAGTIKTMTTPPAAYEHYACGWLVNKVPNWWHNGSLPGTSSLMVRTASGMCWAALVNIRAEGIGLALDQMMWKIARAVPAWRA